MARAVVRLVRQALLLERARDIEEQEGRCPCCKWPLRPYLTIRGPLYCCDCQGPSAGDRERYAEERKLKARNPRPKKPKRAQLRGGKP